STGAKRGMDVTAKTVRLVRERRVDGFRAFDPEPGDQRFRTALRPGDRRVLAQAFGELGPDAGQGGRRECGVLVLEHAGQLVPGAAASILSFTASGRDPSRSRGSSLTPRLEVAVDRDL